jgi:hypothetical protein
MRSDRSDQEVDDHGGKAMTPSPDDREAGRRAREQDLLRELAEVTGWDPTRRGGAPVEEATSKLPTPERKSSR